MYKHIYIIYIYRQEKRDTLKTSLESPKPKIPEEKQKQKNEKNKDKKNK